ncbi:hypothetical protein [Salisediminibacterium beveridgei]|nr:hypothetical protein [Salisediminibacterium beveridgei]
MDWLVYLQLNPVQQVEEDDWNVLRSQYNAKKPSDRLQEGSAIHDR